MRAAWCAAAIGAVWLSTPLRASAQCDQQLEPGDVLVTSLATGRVHCFDRPPAIPGAPVAPLAVPTGGTFAQPRGLEVDQNGLLLVADNGPRTLSRVDPSRDERRIVAQFSVVSSALRGVAAPSDGRLFVVDPGIVPLVEPPLPPIRGVTYFPVLSEVEVVDGLTSGGAVAGCSNETSGTATCGNLFLPTGVAIESEEPELFLLVADAGDPKSPPPGRVRQGVIRVFPDRPFDPPAPPVDPTYPVEGAGINDELFCAPGPFATPRSLAIDPSPGREGSVLVTDSGDASLVPPVPASVIRVSSAGCDDAADPPTEIVAEGNGLVRPIGIAVADDGTIFVADATADTVFRIDPATGVVSPLSIPGSIDQAWDLKVWRASPAAYFVADASAPAVVFDVDPAVPSRTTLTSGGSLLAPAALEPLPAGAGLVVADPAARAVIEVAPGGAQTTVSQAGRLVAPSSASREATGSYLVTDPGDPSAVPPIPAAVIRVSPGSQTLVSEGGKLVRPVAGAIDASAFLIVADAGDGTTANPPRLVRISPTAGLGSAGQLQLFEGPPLYAPVAVALDERGGVILVADRGDATHPPAVLRFVREGAAPGEIAFVLGLSSGGLFTTPAGMFGISGIGLASDRSILVSDAGGAAADDGAVVRVDAFSGLQSRVAIGAAGELLAAPTGIGVLAPTPGNFVDQDADGITDAEDNCLSVVNTDQRDTDDEGIGNACDPDYNNDGVVGTADFAAIRRAFGAAEGNPDFDPDLDNDGDGTIGLVEFALVRDCFGTIPGRSGRLVFDPAAAYCRP